MMSRPWILSETTYTYTQDHKYDVAVLPFGATEPHNLHLPYGMDVFEGTLIGERICEAAHARGAPVVLLPTVPYGTETNQQAFPLAMNLNPSTLFAVLKDIVATLETNGIYKLLVLNSHGGNEFKWMLRELYGQTRVHLFLCNWYQMILDRYDEIFAERDDHAGEMETSFALANFPQLVVRTPDGQLAADEGTPAKTRFDALNQGWVTITRPWHLLTRKAGVGNPFAATAEKGEQMMELITTRLAGFLVELAQTPIDERFPFA
jgi:creatinine amidohydrolase